MPIMTPLSVRGEQELKGKRFTLPVKVVCMPAVLYAFLCYFGCRMPVGLVCRICIPASATNLYPITQGSWRHKFNNFDF